jgi:phosphoglycerate kinase
MDEVYPGYLMEKEMVVFESLLTHPKRPFIAVLGGAKVSDKIGVIQNLLKIADKVIIGGGMSYTFLKAQGYEIGTSLVEEDKLDLARELLTQGKDKLVFAQDFKVTQAFSNDAPIRIAAFDDFQADEMGLDIGPKTLELFSGLLKTAQTVVWNGPVGVFEMSNFAQGTEGICQVLAGLEGATTIIGGGDSAAAAIQMGFEQSFTHISTGGGASLEYLEGKTLPGIEALKR